MSDIKSASPTIPINIKGAYPARVPLNRNLSPRLCCTFGCRKRCLLVLLTLLFAFAIPMAWGSSAVTLAWDANTETNLAGYKVYYGPASGLYTNTVDVGNITTNRVTGLVEGVTYYFAVTAYNSSGQESDYSAEISYRAALTNQPPTISQVSDQQALLNALVVVPFTVGDNETPADSLLLGSFAADPSVVASITLSGLGSNRVATIVPALGLAGSSTITLWVSDGVLSNATTFRVSFADILSRPPVNTPPFISTITDQLTPEDVPTVAMPFVVGDAETAASNLVLTAASSNPALLPLSGIQLGGTDTNRTIQLRPVANQFGTAIVTVSVSDGALSTSTTFQLVVTPVNDPPQISGIANQTLNEDTASALLNFTVSDVDSPATNLNVSASSSNPSLIPASSISLGASADGSNRTLRLTPATNQFGSATITLTVSDGLLANSTSFLLTVNPVNDAPTISFLPNQLINEDTTTAPIPFTIGDVDTSVSNLVVSASSSNPTLIPASAILLGGAGSNRTITLRPATNQFGTVTITLSVSDGALSSTTTFSLTVNPVNDSPLVSTMSNQVINEDTASSVLPFTVGDAETPASNLVVSASSSNPALVSASGLKLGGSGSSRTLQIFPNTNQFGTATITLSVGDGTLTSMSSFLLTVNPVNDAPVISSVPDQAVNEDTATASILFTVSDVDSSASNLVLSATSSNPALVPTSAIVFGGSGSNRTVKILPATNLFGSATITLLVSDGSLSTYSSFVLTVNSVNDAPTLSTFKDLAIPRSGSAGPIAFLVGDAETPSTNLVVTASSSNLYLIPTSGITFGGSGSNRTVTIKPLRRRTGTATITIQVSDGLLTTSQSFLVTVGTTALAPTTGTAFLAEDLEDTSLNLSWSTTAGGIYRLSYKTNLSDPLWIPAAPDIQATQDVTTWTESTTNGLARFYRIEKIQ
jgi:Bacterial Ig domain/Fibronectin type III domain